MRYLILREQLEGFVPAIPDWANDKHTIEGKKLGRGMKHCRWTVRLDHRRVKQPLFKGRSVYRTSSHGIRGSDGLCRATRSLATDFGAAFGFGNRACFRNRMASTAS